MLCFDISVSVCSWPLFAQDCGASVTCGLRRRPEIFRHTLRFQMKDDVFDLFIGHERAVDALDTAAAGHEQHVALASSCSAPCSPRMVRESIFEVTWKEHTGREVGLDRTGDDIDRRALGGHDDMDAGGAGHLRQALDGAFDLLAGDHHQVGHLVDDDDEHRASARRKVPRARRPPRRCVRSNPVCTVRLITSPFFSASFTRALKPSMLRTPSFDILR
jgi:hypothetical protein